jgi:hypothetical protein
MWTERPYKAVVLCSVTPCRLVVSYRRPGRNCYQCIEGIMLNLEETHFSKMLVTMKLDVIVHLMTAVLIFTIVRTSAFHRFVCLMNHRTYQPKQVLTTKTSWKIYNKTDPTYARYCLFIYLFPGMFRQVAMPLSRRPYQNYIRCAWMWLQSTKTC